MHRRPIEAVGHIFADEPAVYVDEEGFLGASLETANRAVYATRRTAEAGWISSGRCCGAEPPDRLFAFRTLPQVSHNASAEGLSASPRKRAFSG